MEFQQQTSSPAAWDEAYAQDGAVREHWQYLLGSLEALGAEEFGNRQQALERILRDDGATYNDYSAGLVARPWTLDPIPLLIDSQEWNRIESGVRERAELLNLVLRDLYGERTLLRHGIVPAELVYSHHGFLRECQGIALPGDQQLILYATDMVRGPDGEVRVFSDRAQTPSGAGYALENRLVMTRVFPSLFRDSHVHRLSLYFNSLRLTLNALNPNGELPRVVVLTPGAYNETYFEHVFLANFLGYQLVQGSDLTVRDGYVWMKTLDGLSRIDVIVRRVDDVFCDPVELKSDSQLGIPGLLEAVRLGNVAVANPLGSGILENRGLMRYLPAAARHFLGRDLSLQSVASFWCGDQQDLAYVLDNLPSLIVKTTFRGPDSQIVSGAQLDDAGLAQLRDTILANPLKYVAQEHLRPSALPVWESGTNSPRPAVLRSFAVAGESSYTVMPGGLTRVGVQPGEIEISNRLGSLSKDTWVLASEPEKQAGPVAAAEVGSAGRIGGGVELPSRVVENLFWVGRYTERSEAALRLLRTVFTVLRAVESPDAGSRPLLLKAVTQLTATYPGFMGEISEDALDGELLSVVLDTDRPGSVMYSLTALLDAVDQVKDFMSADTQRILNDLRDEMDGLPARLRHGFSYAPEEELDSLVTTLLALAGLAQESMVRGQGWHFLDLGRRIERTLQTTSLLRSLWVPAMPEQDEFLLLESALVSLESLMTYRRRYQRDLHIANCLDLLLLEADNPRALIYQLQIIERHLAALPNPMDGARLSREQRWLLEASSSLRLADVQQLAQPGEQQFLRGELDQLLARVQHLVSEVATSLSDRYFDHTAGPQPMSSGELGTES
jgi:uncharacterized circularly permuted ATP-grasp superfamily protein/uncharacterized alpha-E superfamily protein